MMAWLTEEELRAALAKANLRAMIGTARGGAVSP
jgi:hypothetical protein